MSELSYIVVGLALGGDHELAAFLDLARAAKPGTTATEIFAACLKIADDPKLQEQAEKIVLTYAAHLADGNPVDDHMRRLIAAWCRRRLNGSHGGRPPNSVIKKDAVAQAFIERSLRHPSAKREAIIEEVGKEFGLKRRRVFELIKGIDLETLGEAD